MSVPKSPNWLFGRHDISDRCASEELVSCRQQHKINAVEPIHVQVNSDAKINETFFHLFSKPQESLSPQKYVQHMATALDLLYEEVKLFSYWLNSELVPLKKCAHTVSTVCLAGSQGDCQRRVDPRNWGSSGDQKKHYWLQRDTKVIPLGQLNSTDLNLILSALLEVT